MYFARDQPVILVDARADWCPRNVDMGTNLSHFSSTNRQNPGVNMKTLFVRGGFEFFPHFLPFDG